MAEGLEKLCMLHRNIAQQIPITPRFIPAVIRAHTVRPTFPSMEQSVSTCRCPHTHTERVWHRFCFWKNMFYISRYRRPRDLNRWRRGGSHINHNAFLCPTNDAALTICLLTSTVASTRSVCAMVKVKKKKKIKKQMKGGRKMWIFHRSISIPEEIGEGIGEECTYSINAVPRFARSNVNAVLSSAHVHARSHCNGCSSFRWCCRFRCRLVL